MSRPAVVVVGGGLAGLAAGLACVDGGAQVTLVERQPRLGGATWSFTRDGRSFDNGQHVFLRCCEAYRGFLERLGVADLTHLQSRLDVPVLRPGLPPARLWRAPLPVPAHLAGALATYGPIPLRERLGVARTALA
ncbi:MAG: FAD-dependent oxidoreductase, partial [Acidimicrobiales bacterium]